MSNNLAIKLEQIGKLAESITKAWGGEHSNQLKDLAKKIADGIFKSPDKKLSMVAYSKIVSGVGEIPTRMMFIPNLFVKDIGGAVRFESRLAETFCKEGYLNSLF